VDVDKQDFMTQARDEAKSLVVVIAGPTASGKSDLAVAVAEAFDGVVINADSMQIYRGLEVLTAQPDAALRARVPHRLYGTLSPDQHCSAGRWRALALAEIDDALAAGRLPIVVGGSGLYLKALEEGLSEIPAVPEEVRRATRERLERDGPAAFRAALIARDPAAKALHVNDRQRLLRRWEVLEASGRTLSDWQSAASPQAAPYDFLWLVLLPPRERIYADCDRRFEAMLAAGADEEVGRLLALELSPELPAMKALGLPELAALLRGEQSEQAAIAAAKTATRRYAKRQLTWIKTQVLGHKKQIVVFEEKFSERLTEKIFPIIRQEH
jgi:tRNA dimethylallyltransferase